MSGQTIRLGNSEDVVGQPTPLLMVGSTLIYLEEENPINRLLGPLRWNTYMEDIHHELRLLYIANL